MKLLNFIEEAVPTARKFIASLDDIYPPLIDFSSKICDGFENAQKFVLPTDGIILSDYLRGIPQELTLPYPEIAIEYEQSIIPNEKGKGHRDDFIITKVVALVSTFSDTKFRIAVLVYNANPVNRGWILYPYIGEVGRKLNVISKETGQFMEDFDLGIQDINNELSINLRAGLFPGYENSHFAEPEGMNLAKSFMNKIFRVVMELLEALSCSNVRCGKFKKKFPSKQKNKEAYKDIVYNVLMVDSTPIGISGQKTELEMKYTSRSPREHLRRGHIRRLQSGVKVWVQSCVVNPGIGGTVNKTYAVKT